MPYVALFKSRLSNLQMYVQVPEWMLSILFTITKTKQIYFRRNSYYGEAIIKENTTCYPIVF